MQYSRILMIIGSLMLLSLFAVPLWNISLQAPQYPTPVGMDIWINQIKDHHPNDIQNINILNHYVGMNEIPTEMKEFQIFPVAVFVMAIAGVILGFLGKSEFYLLWVIVLALMGVAAMYDFYLWEYDYGHNLKANAAIKFVDPQGEPMSYQPPLLGTKHILNFKAMSYPMMGTYLLLMGMALSTLAYYLGKIEKT